MASSSTDASVPRGKDARHGWPCVCLLSALPRRLLGASPGHGAAEDRAAPPRPALPFGPVTAPRPVPRSGASRASGWLLGPSGPALAPALGRWGLLGG